MSSVADYTLQEHQRLTAWAQELQRPAALMAADMAASTSKILGEGTRAVLGGWSASLPKPYLATDVMAGLGVASQALETKRAIDASMQRALGGPAASVIKSIERTAAAGVLAQPTAPGIAAASALRLTGPGAFSTLSATMKAAVAGFGAPMSPLPKISVIEPLPASWLSRALPRFDQLFRADLLGGSIGKSIVAVLDPLRAAGVTDLLGTSEAIRRLIGDTTRFSQLAAEIAASPAYQEWLLRQQAEERLSTPEFEALQRQALVELGQWLRSEPRFDPRLALVVLMVLELFFAIRAIAERRTDDALIDLGLATGHYCVDRGHAKRR